MAIVNSAFRVLVVAPDTITKGEILLSRPGLMGMTLGVPLMDHMGIADLRGIKTWAKCEEVEST